MILAFKLQSFRPPMIISRLFDARSKFRKRSFEGFQKYLSNNPLSKEDYENLMRQIFDSHRNVFSQYLQLLIKYEPNLLCVNLKRFPVFLQLCECGTLTQVEDVLKQTKDISTFCHGQNPLSYILNRFHKLMKKQEKKEALQIMRLVITAKPSFVTQKTNKPLLIQALECKQYQCAEILIDEGADCRVTNEHQENLLHILYKGYSKKQEKNILYLRHLLIEKDVDEQKVNAYDRRPLDFCPAEFQKRINEQRKAKRQHNHYKYVADEADAKGKTKHEQPPAKSTKASISKVLTEPSVDLNHDGPKSNTKDTARNDKQPPKSKQPKKQPQREKKRVFTPNELKCYLQEDIKYQVEKIEKENNDKKEFFNELIQKLSQEIHEKLDAKFEIFGSFATDLCLPESDIDIVIVSDCYEEFDTSFRLLESVHQLLQHMNEEIQSAKFIKTASVPIIKVQCTQKYFGKKIDITFQDDNHNGLQSVKLIKEYLDIYPQLRALTIILKKFIYSARLFDPYSGGISSYGLILMIVAYIQHDSRRRRRHLEKQGTPAELLIGFLRFYGFDNSYIGKGIYVMDTQQAKKQLTAQKQQPYYEHDIYRAMQIDMEINYNNYNEWHPRPKLMIRDPLNESNNVGRATHKITQIKYAFEMAYVCIHTNKQCGSKRKCESYRRIKERVRPNERCVYAKRPCCILERMLKAPKRLITQ